MIILIFYSTARYSVNDTAGHFAFDAPLSIAFAHYNTAPLRRVIFD
jgi:hypothetical protein